MNYKTEMDDEELINTLSGEIEMYLQNKPPCTEYILNQYGSIEIDGIPIEILIFGSKNYKYMYNIIVNNIKYNDTVKYYEDDEDDDKVIISVSEKYDTVKELLQNLVNVIQTYSFIDCFLLSPSSKKRVFLQRSFLFSFSSKYLSCCVCKNPTIEYTICKHPICLHCRYKCLSVDNNVCPVCRDGDLQIYPNHFRCVLEEAW